VAVRVHLGLAALILISGIVAGWWFGRTAAGPNDPVGMRNAIASSDAIVVTYQRAGASSSPLTTITFIENKGWVWDRAGANGTTAGQVIATSSRTLAAAAPGCYIEIPGAETPLVPGVNLARDLEHAPDLHQEGQTYSYHLATGDDDDNDEITGTVDVTENLAALAVAHSYTARVNPVGRQPTSGAVQPGIYTVRRASDAEREMAEKLLRDTKASPVAEFTVQQRAVVVGQEPQLGAMQMVSPKACPGAVVINPTIIGAGNDPSVFTESNAQATLGAGIRASSGGLALSGVLPLDLSIGAPASDLLNAITSGTPQIVALKQGVTFAVQYSAGATPAVMSISQCQAQPWFPC
jgi:hypothetical protein